MPKQEGGGGGSFTLKQLVAEWKTLDEQIKEKVEYLKQLGPGSSAYDSELAKVDELKERRRNFADRVVNRVEKDPDKWDAAVSFGFNENILDTRVEEPSEPPGGGGKPDLTGQAADNRLLGDKGKHWDVVRGPKGSYVIRYKFKIKGEVVTIGLRVGEKSLGKYGIKPGDAKQLTAAQMKRIESIGWADELAPHMKRGDGNVIKSLVRSLARQYGGQPMLEDDEVMSVIIANSLFGWTPGEFENQLRQTKWYRNTNEYQRNWGTLVSPKQKKDIIKSTFEQVVNHLEDVYGFGWAGRVEGGAKKAREWAEKIASGQFGEPSMGFQTWAERMFDKASEIEGTNAWIESEKQREDKRKWLNRPEDMFERIREEALTWLGYDEKNTPRLDKGSLQGWAADLVSGKKSEGDWQNFLRQQMKALFPYFDPNRSFQEQASPYKSIAERLLGDTLDWTDALLRDFAAVDDKGKGTGEPLSLHDFELKVRGDESLWKPGTAMFDEGMEIVRALEQTMLGVG